jgi:hypothetical protein
MADETDRDYRDTYEELTGISLFQCPDCHFGRMVFFRALQPVTPIPLSSTRHDAAATKPFP